jgi:regulator of protease activity HflC (stomatin/prohibitin superfamily)
MVLLEILGIFVLLVFIAAALSGVKIVQPYEQAVLIRLGNYVGKLNPGFNWVAPLITRVVRVDLRTQVLNVPRQEVITKDNSPTNVDAVVFIRVMSPDKALFEVTDYRSATLNMAQTTLRSTIGEMDLDEILFNREVINAKLRDQLDTSTDRWGVRVEGVEIREVDPIGRVKAAMEAQTTAERERRAAILKADGEKRAAILAAEGDKRAAVLQAEGVRQAKILEAEGTRLARILEAQGQAQGLRILSLGAATMDQRALTVLSMDTTLGAVRALGSGQATKFILPMEVTDLLRGVGQYLGVDRDGRGKEPAPADVRALEGIVGKAEQVLGRIPSPEELRAEMSLRAEQEKEGEKEITALLTKRKLTEEEPAP